MIKLGHPYGYRADRGATARLGRVLYTGPSIEIVADCLTFGGDSGGPLIDLDGRLVGLAENGSAPQIVIWSMPDRCGNALCYASTATIARLLPAMLDPPRGTRPVSEAEVKDLPEEKALIQQRRKELYGDVDSKVIPQEDWSQGKRTRAGVGRPGGAVFRERRRSARPRGPPGRLWDGRRGRRMGPDQGERDPGRSPVQAREWPDRSGPRGGRRCGV